MTEEEGGSLVKKILIIAVTTLVLINIIFAGILTLDALTRDRGKKEAVLSVDEVYFVQDDIQGNEITLTVNTFITNDGEKSCQGRIRAFAIDVDTNLAIDETEKNIGEIPPEKTVEVSISISLETDGKYRVELMIFKDDMISVKGRGTVNVEDKGTGGQDYRTTTYDDVDEDEEKSVPYPAFGLVAAAIAVVVIIYRRRRS
ncbi:MAG: hypothetical protein ACMUIG_03375 [Thermoplasmatota archaeon]